MDTTPLWHLSSTRTRRAWLNTKKKYGSPSDYFPRYNLIQRWATTLGWSEDKVIEQFYRERKFMVKLIKGETILG